MCLALTSFDAATAEPRNDPSPDWWSRISAGIQASEYGVTLQPEPGRPSRLHAANRAQDLRAHFTEDGVELTDRSEQPPSWTLGLSLLEFAERGDVWPAERTEPEARGTKVVYEREGISETWENTPAGITVRLEMPPAFGGPYVRVGFRLDTDLEAAAAGDGSAITFYRGGVPVLRARASTEGRGLPVRLDVDGDRLRIGHRLQALEGTTAPHAAPAIPEDPIDIALVFTGPSRSAATSALSDTPDWFAESNRSDARFGTAVALAGDVDGDGFGDVIVGAPKFDGGQLDEGRAFLYRGSAAGLSTSSAWTTQSNQAGAEFGSAVATAGDVDGDGFDDVLVAANNFSNGETGEGRVFLYAGSATGLSTSTVWTAEGDQVEGFFGGSVATAGDVNDDGFDDVVIGAQFFDNGEPDEGRAFVYLGSAAGLSGTPVWTVEGDQMNAQLGASVATAGDVDADGIDDVIVGIPLFDDDQVDEGRAAVFLGSSAGPQAAPAWTATGDQASAAFGTSVANAGDVDGDGFGDVIVGASFFDNGESDEGAAFAFAGSAAGPSLTAVWMAEGELSGGRFGQSVAPAGDVNGDGYADVIVGAPLFSNGQSSEGRAFIYLGSASGLSAIAAVTLESDQDGALFGLSVSAAGDVNGDGFGDVIVGASKFTNGQLSEGRAFAYYGSPSNPSGSPASSLGGDQSDGRFGTSVAPAGDVNGDGFGDVIVGASRYDNGESNEGRAFLYQGSPSGLGGEPTWAVEADNVGALYGTSVAGAGDVNGDGFGDVIVGAPEYTNDQNDEGRSFVYLGSPGGLSTTAAWTAEGDQPDAQFGDAVAAAGDVNGDGFGDVVIGARQASTDQDDEGRAFVYLGSASGLSASPAWSAEGDQEDAEFGDSVSAAGDVNGDGFGDIVVGATQFDNGQANEGRALLYLGSASGPSERAAWSAEGEQNLALFGASVSTAGDVNGDGFSDVVVGAPLFNNGESREGQIFVYLGSAAGLSRLAAFTADGGQEDARFGTAVATAGDVNLDGFGDVIVGAPLYDNGESEEGRALVLLGSPTGLSDVPAWTAESDQSNAQFGSAVAAAGDVNGDGAGDLVVGAGRFDNPFDDEGGAFVYYGNGGAGVTRPLSQLRVDDGSPIALLGKSDSDDAFRVRATGYSAAGRGEVRLEWEAKPTSVAFVGTELGRGLPTDTGFPFEGRSSVPLEETVDGLDVLRGTCDNAAPCVTDTDCLGIGGGVCRTEREVFYRWRVRVATDSPFFPRSPWLTLPGSNVSEVKLRTAADLPPPRFRLVGPRPNEPVFADTDPLIFTWNRGGSHEFRLEWSRNPEFAVVVETSAPVEASDAGDIQVFRPDGDLWRRILQLAQSPDIRETPIFWRIVPTDPIAQDPGRPEVRAIRMAPASPVTVVSPPPGAEFEAAEPPTLVWEPNHNERYRVMFSTTPNMRWPRVHSGPDTTIVETAWQVPEDVWSAVVEMARDSPGGVVHYVVFARDALDRLTFGRTGVLRVLLDDSASAGSSRPRVKSRRPRLRRPGPPRRP